MHYTNLRLDYKNRRDVATNWLTEVFEDFEAFFGL